MADEAETTSNPKIRTVPLDTPIIRGETKIESIQLRKPGGGELRGISLVQLGQLQADALHTLIPRISIPPLTKPEAMALEADDLLACGIEIGDFLLQNRRRTAAPEQ
ncbi:Phage tail assembly chaperone protein, E, or 41 or 14 [Sphingomonas laterariae]|uniref:Phage tail assembly chaperone protein, E, or 41 or 14 n=1 Tax=Edaphosphingomonas laterariae TaxID=861865 RepID=A0A239CL26_9SPHN|nr:phage tail assembly protein [Sphingomonas laterariae]SNS20649.1 Phage tail assembly chaperone protein, E, or 41 or 14 [Sphingomonas laterariae]